MDQSQGGNPFGRLIEFARPHKTGYIVSVVLAVLGVAFGSQCDWHHYFLVFGTWQRRRRQLPNV